LDWIEENVWIPGVDDWDELDGGRTLKVAGGAIEMVAGAVACPTTGVGCLAAVHGFDVVQSGIRDERTFTAKGVTAVTGSEGAGDVADILISLGTGVGSLGKLGSASKLPGAAVSPFAATVKSVSAGAKAEAGAAAAGAAKTTARARTLSGVGPYKATTAGANFGQRRMMQHIESTPGVAKTPVRTTGQYELAQETGRSALKKASALTVE
jgi:hypothetical protein